MKYKLFVLVDFIVTRKISSILSEQNLQGETE